MERFNASLNEKLQKTVKLWDGQWDLVLPHILGKYRRAAHQTTGFTPSELLYRFEDNFKTSKRGRRHRRRHQQILLRYLHNLSSDRFEAIQEASRAMKTKKKIKYKQQHDLKAKERCFQPGDLVLPRIPTKGPSIEAEWDGPYSVAKKVNKTTYELYMPEHPRRRVKHHILLKEYHSPAMGCLTVTEELSDGEAIGDCLLGDEEGAFPNIDSDIINDQERAELQTLLESYKELFRQSPGCAQGQDIRLETGEAYPVSKPRYRMSPTKLAALEAEVKT